MNANAPRPAITMTATMIRTMYIFGSFRFGATGVISGPDGPEGPGSICDSVGCILAPPNCAGTDTSPIRAFWNMRFTHTRGRAHLRTASKRHSPRENGAPRAALLRRIDCPTHPAEIDS